MKSKSYLRRKLIVLNSSSILEGDGLAPETAFIEPVLMPHEENGFNLFLEPLLGKQNETWRLVQEEYVQPPFITCVRIQLNDGADEQYYFDQSANFRL